jgi:phosphatidylserine/phosphatidylglycerophosphate/cardiolipin synthase-like enzyme
MLQKEGISIFYDKRVHAKIIVADKKVAVVSSMNFYADSSAGASWEAGLVSTNKEVVQKIYLTFYPKWLSMFPRATEQNEGITSAALFFIHCAELQN